MLARYFYRNSAWFADAAMKLDRAWLVNALTSSHTSTLVVGAGVRRSVSISLWSRGYLSVDLHARIPWICSHFKNQPHRNHRSRKQPTRNLRNNLQLKVAGPVDMSLSLLSTSYLVLNIALNIITAFKHAKIIKLLTLFKANFKARFFSKGLRQRLDGFSITSLSQVMSLACRVHQECIRTRVCNAWSLHCGALARRNFK